jgi:segregation and condensation protein A
MNSNFTVEQAFYQGPFPILLELIEKHKLSINEVSLSTVTEDYIEYIKKIDGASLGEISSFTLIAATLMLIKSRSLLPNLSVTEEEKTEIKTLESRLETFQLVKALSGYIKNAYEKKILYKRPFVKTKQKYFSPDPKITQEILLATIAETLKNIPKELKTPETKVKQSLKIEEVLVSLFERVKKEASFSFQDFAKAGTRGLSKSAEIKVFMVVSFLAMLELVKGGDLDALQEENFGDIIINSR